VRAPGATALMHPAGEIEAAVQRFPCEEFRLGSRDWLRREPV
jgi:hypothetical protein